MEMTTIDKMVALIELLAVSKGDMSIREIEKESKVSRSTAHRILQNLQKHNWVAQDADTERYRIGLRFLFLYNTDSFYRHFLDIARPVINSLVNATGQTALISVLDGVEGYCIYAKTPSALLQYAAYPGMRFPIYAGATGKVLLAFAPEVVREKVLKESKIQVAPNTVVDEGRLRMDIMKIRENGFAFSTQELQDQTSGVSIPILGRCGELIAQFGIAGPAMNFEGRFEQFLFEVKKAGTLLSEALNSGCGKN